MMYFLELTDLDIHIIHMSILFYIAEFTTLDLDLDMLGLQNVIHVKSPHLSGCVKKSQLSKNFLGDKIRMAFLQHFSH